MSNYDGLKWWRSKEAQKEALYRIKEAKDFNSIRQNMQKDENVRHKKQRQVESCNYCGTVPCLWKDL